MSDNKNIFINQDLTKSKNKMQIAIEKIEEYQRIYKEKNGKEISPAKAREELHALVCLIDAVHRHINK